MKLSRFTAFCLAQSLTLMFFALSPTPAFADDPPAAEDDLLDGDLDDLDGDSSPAPSAKPLPRGVAAPPPAIKNEVDARVAELAARADALGDELFEELPRLPNAEEEIRARIAEAQQREKDLAQEVERLSKQIQAKEEKKSVIGYGATVDLNKPSQPFERLRGRPLRDDPFGRSQFNWWQSLLGQLGQNVKANLRGLSQARINALKAEADSLALSQKPAHRAYVNLSVRRALEGSALGRNLVRRSDPRLNDLYRGRPQKGAATAQTNKARKAANPLDLGNSREQVRVELLPRVRDPITGLEKPIVNLTLGDPPGGR
ncbi:MAG TPA: hypothetical protein DEA08_20905 [Planctomycetes bacterium]|nr:hypothetical protein [Planctomycetota bacterium]